MQQTIGQFIGVVAFLSTAFAFLQHDEKKLKNFLTLAGVVWCIHFLFMEAYTGAAIVAVGTIRQFVSAYFHYSTEKLRIKFVYIFIVINALVTILTWQNFFSLFPFLASTLAIIALFLWSGLKLTKGMLFIELFWFIYNVSIMSFGGISANFANTSILLYRLINQGKNKNIEQLEKATCNSVI